MRLFNKIKHKYNEVCILIWLKWIFYTEDYRKKLESMIYKTDKNLKSRD